jgi:6-aminohexanoate-oligomer exohydrolase
MAPDTAHLLMSVSKSVAATALGISIGRGLLAATDLVTDVAPQFRGSSLEGATVQHVIDMTAGTDFVEDYSAYDDPDGDDPLIEYERQAGYRRMLDRPLLGVHEYFHTFGTAYPHGDRFEYRSPLTNVASRMVEIVNGLSYADVVSRDLWGPLGQEHDADIMLDCRGAAIVEGGMSCSVRDLARYGLAHLDDGMVDGEQVIPADWVADTRHGTDDNVRAFTAGDSGEAGWSQYRNAFWVIERDQVTSGLGIFGQYCYVHRPSRTVIARFSTFPDALPLDLSIETMACFAAITDALAGAPH